MSYKKINPDDVLKNVLSNTSIKFAESALIEAAEGVVTMLEQAEYISRSLDKPGAKTDFIRRKPLEVLKEFPALVSGVALLAGLREMYTSSVAQDKKITSTVSEKITIKCSCRIDSLQPGVANNRLQAWLAEHPNHTRKEHTCIFDFLKWLDDYENGGLT